MNRFSSQAELVPGRKTGDGATFHRVFDALLTGRPLRIDYLSPHR
ncbi:MAG TPA: hypothetical protein PKK12_05895 [Candidatus Aminicenantes bacterium]|nr:hypothetical protein [Candidatus Aminicenantes bacterium]